MTNVVSFGSVVPDLLYQEPISCAVIPDICYRESIRSDDFQKTQDGSPLTIGGDDDERGFSTT